MPRPAYRPGARGISSRPCNQHAKPRLAAIQRRIRPSAFQQHGRAHKVRPYSLSSPQKRLRAEMRNPESPQVSALQSAYRAGGSQCTGLYGACVGGSVASRSARSPAYAGITRDSISVKPYGLQSPVHGFDSRLRLVLFDGLRPSSRICVSPGGTTPRSPPMRASPARRGWSPGTPEGGLRP